MIEVLRSSLLWRLFCFLAMVWKNCFIMTVCRAIARIWQNSKVVTAVANRVKHGKSSVGHSGVARWMQRFNNGLSRLGGKVMPGLRSSLLYNIYGKIWTWGRESKLIGWLFRGGMTGFLLVAVGAYCIIDYILRDIFAIPVISSGWDEALLVFALIWVAYTRMRSATPLKNRCNPMDTPVFFFITLGFGLLFLVSPFFASIGVPGYRATMQYMLWFFVVTRLVQNDRDFMTLYFTLVAVAFVIALHGIYQYVVAAPMPANWIDQAEESVRTRVYSIFGSPNIMGDYMVMFAPMAVGLAYSVKNRTAKILCWAVGLSMCLACLFTMSRGAWAALALAIVIFACLVDRRLLVVILIAAVIAMFIPFVSSRIGYLLSEEYAASTANGGRNSRWDLAMNYLATSPVFGVGFGMFGGAIAMQHKIYRWLTYFYVDNYYLKILTEMGYLGFGAFVILMGSAIWNGFRAVMRTRKTKLHPLCAGMVAGLSGVLLHCYSENIFEEPYMMVYFWSMVALLVYAGFLRKHTTKGM